MAKLSEPKKNHGTNVIDTMGIMERIPHRYPFLLIDKVIDLIPGESATGVKNVTINEPYFMGHFPQRPIMPGVLIVEAMAQTAAVVVVDTLTNVSEQTHMVYFMTIEQARFRKPVEPGDTLYIKVRKDKHRGNVWRFRGEAYVNDVLCAEAMFTAMLAEKSALESISS
jgi:3-hydroxyacyl-[acyl-carrier-protein] dehydratase